MTSYNGVDLTALTLGGGTWYTATDGSWAVTMEGIVPGSEVSIPAGGGNCNLSLSQPSNWPSTYPLAGSNPGPGGSGISQITNLYTYRAPSAYRATTGSASSPSDATGRVTLSIPGSQPAGAVGYLLDSGPPARYQVFPPAPQNGVGYVLVTNPLGVPVLMQSVTFTLDLWIQSYYYPPAVYYPPTSPTQPPSGTTSTTVPLTPNQTTTATRRRLEQSNPGYTVRWTRQERFPDFGQVTLGQRGQLTIPFAGFEGRGHLVTGVELHVTADDDPIAERSVAIYTLEKVPGTILPGAGTSNSSQDAAGTGAEIGLYHIIDDAASGIGLGALG